ncbi:hypothetical protein WA016_03108 [Myxococcus stipitatus]
MEARFRVRVTSSFRVWVPLGTHEQLMETTRGRKDFVDTRGGSGQASGLNRQQERASALCSWTMHTPLPPEAAPGSQPTELHVCHNCLVKLDSSLGGVDLPRRIREALAARGLAPTSRVVSSGCLGECPRGKVTVLVIPPSGVGCHARLIDPEKDGEDLAEHLERRAARAERP